MKLIKKRKSVYRIIALIMAMIFLCAIGAVPAFASGGAISNSTIGIGTKDLFKDLTSFLLVALPIVIVIMIIYFSIRKSTATEESEQITWGKYIKNALWSLVVGECAAAIVNILLTYYGGSGV